MSRFGSYAQYYDLLYQDKDYQQEANFVIRLLQQYVPQARTILEVGCGTGRHAEYLLRAGYQVTGVERSSDMLALCRQRHSQLSPDQQANMTMIEGDLRDFRLEQSFDVVLALFHVISYQSTNEDLQAAFTTVAKHLKPGGIFIFDVWYGPAVLHQKTHLRVKRLKDDRKTNHITITRIAEPILYPNDNIVDVNYQILVQDTDNQQYQEFYEVHRMRYLFNPEISIFLKQANLERLAYGEWMTSQPASLNTWGVYFVAVKR